MKESMWGYMLIVLGLAVITIIVLVQNITTTQEEDYYLTREILEASMIDAVDYGTFRTTGEVAIIKEKFVEVFIRRFAESVSGVKDYTIEFYDISENPPKATVRILTNSGSKNGENQSVSVSESADEFNVALNTYLTGILETTDTYLSEKSEYCRVKEDKKDSNGNVVKDANGKVVKIDAICPDYTNCQDNSCN